MLIRNKQHLQHLKLNSTSAEAELKKSVAYKKKHVIETESAAEISLRL